jgi:6-pyruvoyl-tetrahydropterin synthase
MNDGFEVGAVAAFEAFHVMPGAEGPEGKLHPHRYRVEVIAERIELDDRGMVVDLDVFLPSLQSVAASLQGKDLAFIKPEEAEAVTVEVLSRWVHAELASVAGEQGAETLSVRVWESDDAFGGFTGRVR